MQRPSNYRTKQREAIYEYIVSLGNTHVSAVQIVSHFENETISVGRTTIYRHLDKLTQDGKLRRYSVDGISGYCYQYIDDMEEQQDHLLLKCEACGKLFHIDCMELNEIHRHIHQEHAFKVNTLKTVFYGKCASCADSAEYSYSTESRETA